jgi:hypothetical protein
MLPPSTQSESPVPPKIWLGIGIPGLIGKNNVVLDGNVLHGIVRLRRRAEGEVCRFRV